MNAVEKYHLRRNQRLMRRGLPLQRFDDGDGKKHTGTRLPYGLAKSMGIDTKGLAPKEVWELLEGKGFNPEEEYEKLKERGEAKKRSGRNTAPITTFESGGQTFDHIRIGKGLDYTESKDYAWKGKNTPQMFGTDKDGKVRTIGGAQYHNKPYTALYDLKKAGVTHVENFEDQNGKVYTDINPQTFKFPPVLSKRGAKMKVSKFDVPANGKKVVITDWDGNTYDMGLRDIRTSRDKIKDLTGIDILKSNDLSDSAKDVLKEADKIRNVSVTFGGKTYSHLVMGKYGGVSGRTGNDPDENSLVISAKSVENTLLTLKRNGVHKILKSTDDGDEIVDIDSVKLPNVVGYATGSDAETHYTAIEVSRSHDKYTVKGTDLSGTKSVLYAGNTPQDCVKYAKSELHANESDVKVAKEKKETDNPIPSTVAEWGGIIDAGVTEFGKKLRGIKTGSSFSIERKADGGTVERVYTKGSDGWSYVDISTDVGRYKGRTTSPRMTCKRDDMFKYIKKVYDKVRK